MKFCIQCGEGVTLASREIKSPQIGGHQFTAQAPLMKCSKCGLEIVDGASVERFEVLVAQKLIESGICTGAALRYTRKVLELRANELADLLDVKPETVSRWENDKVTPDRALLVVLGGMVADRLAQRTETIDRLRALSVSRKLERVVRIDLRTGSA